MKKRAMAVSALILTLITLNLLILGHILSSIGLGFTGAVVQSSGNSNKIVQSSVYNNIENNGSANVLIQMNPSTPLQRFFSILSITPNSTQIQKQVEDTVGKGRVAYSGNGIFYANLTSSELASIENNSNIKSITPERIFHISSESPTSQINVTSVQDINFNGENLTGKGQTVCVIDTGVDYNNTNLGGCYGNNNVSSDCKVIGGYNFVNTSATPIDDNGHGTHVAGIIAASGNLTGVAPGAKIIAIKVCDASGSCNEAAIQNGLSWCVNNASKFNISVISMSIGTSQLYSGYCSSDPLASEVSKAAAENITIVAASGNNANATAMSSPACIPDVVPVGDTYVENYTGSYSWGYPVICTDNSPRQGQIVCHSNRDNILELLAPGAMINSTVYPGAPVCSEGTCTGSYGQLGGTSMAAPHVSGAIAILRQYSALNNESLSPSAAESILNSSGKRIYDNESNLTFSLINVYSALLSLDHQAPNISLVSPPNGTVNDGRNETFICNSTDILLKKTTLKVWNTTGLFYNLTKSVSGQDNLTKFNLTLPDYEKYEWNCQSTDASNNTAYSVQNSSLIISPGVLYLSPANNTYTNLNETFRCNSTYLLPNQNLSNVTFTISNSTGSLLYNQTDNISGTSNLTNYPYNFTKEGKYLWACSFYTNESNFTDSGNYSIVYDLTPPNITLISPANRTSISGGTQKVKFDYNVTDNFATGNCSLKINNITELSNSTIKQNANEFSYKLSPGNYNWSVTCYDKAGNKNYSQENTFTVKSIPAAASSGSSYTPTATPAASSGGTPTVKNITNGYDVNLSKGSSHIFTINTSSHILTLDNTTASEATLTVRSSPQTFTLKIGESKYLNLSSPDYYDLYIKLNDIKNGVANVTIKELTSNNRIFHIITGVSANNSNNKTSVNKTIKELPITIWKKLEPNIVYIETGVLAFLMIIWILLSIARRAHEEKARKEIYKHRKKRK